ncbi:glycoside hydrolase [Podospora fimiseda]|uniref:Glycoside hydrolase n=1 Tax=Podospora fimiseda TaxID=252190 RepID=A0AAN7BM18_9PEZI|nr:glycoside hydrolase [Podospora fimiseda]
MTSLTYLIALFGLLLPFSSAQAPPPTLPALPLSSSSRWILDAQNNRVKLRCVNWAGHLEPNIPEGLNHKPLDSIVSWIASQGFNCVRLTYSTDLALAGNVTTVSSSFKSAASSWSRPALETLFTSGIQTQNPWIIPQQTTTLDVFSTVINKLYSAQIMTILDNHVSRASWCCNLTDGNGWWDQAQAYNSFNSRFFDTTKWLSGLSFMAQFSLSHPGVIGMSLRNELRAFLFQDLNNRKDWYNFISLGASRVHSANPDLLIIVGGSQSSTDLMHLKTVRPLDRTPYPNKIVWEMHAYSFTVTFPDPFRSCDMVKLAYGAFNGFVLEQGKTWTGPLVLSEFGVGMSGGEDQYDGLNEKDNRYLNCLVSYMENNDADWVIWALQGSYYIRDGTVDYDEGWGLLNHDWSGWRNNKFPARLREMWNVTQGP